MTSNKACATCYNYISFHYYQELVSWRILFKLWIQIHFIGEWRIEIIPNSHEVYPFQRAMLYL